jgi:hypothetical protein
VQSQFIKRLFQLFLLHKQARNEKQLHATLVTISIACCWQQQQQQQRQVQYVSQRAGPTSHSMLHVQCEHTQFVSKRGLKSATFYALENAFFACQ